jgi:hypothetical protein
MINCNLIDAFAVRPGTTAIPQTYKRGNRRIDFIALSPELYPSVARIGFDPFDYRGIHSDHRGLYIDINLDVFGVNDQIPAPPRRHRDFSADKPENVVRYIERKYGELMKHNIEARLSQLENLSTPNHALAERIDKDMTRASKIAAKHVKARPRTPWSPALANIWAEIHLLKMIKSQLKNPQIQNWSAILRWKDSHPGITVTVPHSLQETDLLLKDANSRLKTIRQEAEAHRRKHLEERAMLYASLKEKDKEKIVRRIQRAEDLHRCYLKLK